MKKPVRSAFRWLIAGLFALTATPGHAAVADLAGRYEGAWTNLTFGSTGKAVIDIQVNNSTASLRFDMDGFVFGAFNPPPITMPGTVVGDTIRIDNQGVGAFGDIKGLINATAGSFTASITNVPGGFIRQITAAGSLGDGRMQLDYTVDFPGPGSATNPAKGVMSVVRPPPLVLQAVGLPDGQIRLTWSGGSPPYQVQGRAALENGSWVNQGAAQAGTTVVFPASQPRQFYRVTGN